MILRPLSSSTCLSINSRTSGRPSASGNSGGSILSSSCSKSWAYLTASSACARASLSISRSLSVNAKLIIGRSLSRADQSVEDGQGSGVAVPHLQRQIADEAVAAENLHALVGDAEPVVGAVTLSEPRAAGRRPGLAELGGGSQRHPAHRLGRDMHVRQFEGDALFLRDRLAVHDALFGVGQGIVEHSARKTTEDCAERDARQVDDPLHVGAFAFPEPSAVGDEYVLESDIRHLERAQAQGSLGGGDPDARLCG